ncbi:hypothetical protein B566_EDAN005248 [Ephemera danica]|nr:hypothetical protein B566_EDAN005248 [Ephemera danica]
MSTTATTTITGLLNLTIFLSNITTVVDYDDSALFENFTLEEYIQSRRGPKTLPYSVVVPITVLYALIFLTGMVGNVAVCTVIARNSSMHTATNYYLFSLALSDLTILLLVYWFGNV